MSTNHIQLNKVTMGGLLVTLGIIYGDIGTSPLYVMKAIIGNQPIEEQVVLGALSCIFWTLTLQTTLKYVFLTLKAHDVTNFISKMFLAFLYDIVITIRVISTFIL